MSAKMNNVRANWLLAFRKEFGEKQVVTRQEIDDWKNSWTPGQQGPLKYELRAPSWLTNVNPNPYKVNRGVFRLPWNDLTEWQAEQEAAAAAAAAAPVQSNQVVDGVAGPTDPTPETCCHADEPCQNCPEVAAEPAA